MHDMSNGVHNLCYVIEVGLHSQIINKPLVIYELKKPVAPLDKKREAVGEKQNTEENQEHAADKRYYPKISRYPRNVLGCRTPSPSQRQKRHRKSGGEYRQKPRSLKSGGGGGGKKKYGAEHRTHTGRPAESESGAQKKGSPRFAALKAERKF